VGIGVPVRSGGDGGGSGVARLGCGAAAERGVEAVDATMRDAVGIGVPVRAGREGFERMFVRT
jgi:2-methylcitrate dehydratase PrpD